MNVSRQNREEEEWRVTTCGENAMRKKKRGSIKGFC